MNIKEQLKILLNFSKLLSAKKREIEHLRAGMVTSVQYSEQPKNVSDINATERKLINRLEKIDELIEDIEDLYDIRDKLVDAIDSLEDPLESMVMRLFYVNGGSQIEVRRILDLKPSKFYEIKKHAIEKLSVECR
jgi:DNA-directed RNA polymerase specialized sigma subunit